MKNKKGSAIAGVIVVLMLFIIFAFMFSTMFGVFKDISDKVYEGFSDNVGEIQKHTNENATVVIDNTVGAVAKSQDVWRWVSIALLISMFMGIIFACYLVTVHPAWFVVYILLSVVLIIVAVPVANSYEQMIDDPAWSETFDGFWSMNYIMSNLHYWITVLSLIGGALMFMNMKRTQRGDIL